MMPRSKFIAVLAAALSLLSAVPSVAENDPAVAERMDGQTYVVSGRFDVEAPLDVVWQVLSDYDHLGRFVTSIRRSQVRRRTGNHVLIEQVATGRMLVFSQDLYLMLDVQERPEHQISFRDVSRRDFKSYEGSWTIDGHDGDWTVVYRLRALPRADWPSFVAQHAVQTNAAGLLAQVRAEIIRRASTQVRK